MSYVYYNANPCKMLVGDCVIRAIATASDMSWRETYTRLCAEGLEQCDLPNSNAVWGGFLQSLGYRRRGVSHCTVRQFCKKNRRGTFVLATGSHAVAVIDGNYYDIWDSGNEPVSYYYHKEETE